MSSVRIFAVLGLPEIRPGDDLAREILLAADAMGEPIADHDIVAVAQKVVSKAEGRVRRLDEIAPGERAKQMAAESGKDARLIEAVLGESREIIRWERGVLIAETHHGFVCANAGVDRSNAGMADAVVLLPVDPDASASGLRAAFADMAGVDVGVVITDTFGRAWREGHINVAIGIAGFPALERYSGRRDPEGYELRVTEIAVADEVAAASELVMRKLERCPVAVIRGVRREDPVEPASAYVRSAARDLFR